MDDTVDIERYLSKRDRDLGRAITIVRASRGAPLRPPKRQLTRFASAEK